MHALEVVQASPAAVKQHDKLRWLSLFTPDVRLEDPVGAGEHVGLDRLSSFWDVFIQPNEVTFHPKRDFVRGDRVVRYVTIATVTPVDRTPLSLNAIIEYRVHDERISMLRAYWEPKHAVSWHAKRGLRGVSGLMKHGGRMTFGLGLGAAMGFSRALVPRADRALADRIVFALGDREAWAALAGEVTELDAGPWDPARGAGLALEEVIVAGDHLACVASAGELSVAIVARADAGRVRMLRVLSSAG